MKLSKAELLRNRIRAEVKNQEDWMLQCGGDRIGYVHNYGSKNDAEHSGDGGEAIFEADYNHLKALREQLASLSSPESKADATAKALAQLKDLVAGADPERDHGEADCILMNLITVLLDGDTSIADAFSDINKWYA